MFASILMNKLNGIRSEWNENIFELKMKELMSFIEHEHIDVQFDRYNSKNQINFAEPIEDFSKTKSLGKN